MKPYILLALLLLSSVLASAEEGEKPETYKLTFRLMAEAYGKDKVSNKRVRTYVYQVVGGDYHNAVVSMKIDKEYVISTLTNKALLDDSFIKKKLLVMQFLYHRDDWPLAKAKKQTPKLILELNEDLNEDIREAFKIYSTFKTLKPATTTTKAVKTQPPPPRPDYCDMKFQVMENGDWKLLEIYKVRK